MISFADVATQMNISQTLALALPRFYQRTGISAQINFVYSPKNSSIEISLGFHPAEPTEEQYNILFEEISDAEKLLLDKYIVDNAVNFDNIKKLVFTYKEDIRKIVDRQQRNV